METRNVLEVNYKLWRACQPAPECKCPNHTAELKSNIAVLLLSLSESRGPVSPHASFPIICFIYLETMEMVGIQPQEAQRTREWYTKAAMQGTRLYGPLQGRHRGVVSEGIRAWPLWGAECFSLNNARFLVYFIIFLIHTLIFGCTILGSARGHVVSTAQSDTLADNTFTLSLGALTYFTH